MSSSHRHVISVGILRGASRGPIRWTNEFPEEVDLKFLQEKNALLAICLSGGDNYALVWSPISWWYEQKTGEEV